MSENFRYECARRPAPHYPAEEDAIVKMQDIFGAGSGGDSGFKVDKNGNKSVTAVEDLNATGAEVFISATGSKEADPVIAILAGETGPEGRVSMHGGQGVRITSGPPQAPAAANLGINGIELAAGDTQQITITRGCSLFNDIRLTPGGITVDGVMTPVSITSNTSIVLEVANGLSSITLAPDGIKIKGLITYINS
jgi:hypothetical protein